MLVKRPILVATIGYGIGIIGGLCFSFSIIFFYLLLGIFYGVKQLFLKKIFSFFSDLLTQKRNMGSQSSSFHFISYSRFKRYVRLFITRPVVYLIIISSCISNTIVLKQNQIISHKQDQLEKNTNLELSGIVVSSLNQKQNKDNYIFQTKDQAGKIYQFVLQVSHQMNKTFSYGDQLKIKGEYRRPEKQRNEGGFCEDLMYKQRKELGTIVLHKSTILAHEKANCIDQTIHQITQIAREKVNQLWEEPIHSLFLAMIMGDTSNLAEEQKESFKNAGVYHILAVSGTHMGILIFGIKSLLERKIGKNKTYGVTIACIGFYSLLTGSSPSIMRAAIMSILTLISFFLHRKNDVWNTLAISLLWLWIDNPYSITHIGLQLSYGGTLGILWFSRPLLKWLTKKNQEKQRKRFGRKQKKQKKGIAIKLKMYGQQKVIEIVSVTLSAQFILFPCLVFHFNCFNLYFLISNFLISFLLIPVTILGFLLFFSLFISFSISQVLAIPFSLGMNLILGITQIAKLPLAKIYVTTPTWLFFLLYGLFLFILFLTLRIMIAQKLTITQKRVKNMVALFRFRYHQNHKKIKKMICFLLIFLFTFTIGYPYFFPSPLSIHFVDVGQGDCTFIHTPQNQTILIDGGGSLGTFDIGKNTVLPYLLDHQGKVIDFIIISHFDQDHVGGLLTIMKELRVKNVIIGKQFETCENYEEFKKIVKEKKIKVHIVEAEQIIKIEKGLYFNVLWPSQDDVISENSINNNSLVCKMIYQNYSMLFTGDIEEIAEKAILEKYKGTNILKSTILKVAHHGSKSSSIEEFLDVVKPKIALIGVGEKNTFGHPNSGVLERIEEKRL